MSAGRDRKYYMVGGKGGVGKTSLSSSLAVKFAMNGHPTLLVSTDPAHSLSDSLAQDVTGGVPVCVDGTDAQLYAMEVDPNQAKEEFAAFAKQTDMSQGAKDFMGSVGLGGLADQLGDLKLGELLDTPPAGARRGDRDIQGGAVHQRREVRQVHEDRVRHRADRAHAAVAVAAGLFGQEHR